MIRWVLGLWYAHIRRIDVAVLWPSCKRETGNLDWAKAAFAVHAFRDRAWRCLGEDEICRQIDLLS